MERKATPRLSMHVFLLFLLGCLYVPVALGQTKTGQIEELMAHYHRLGRLHGAVLVAQDGEVVYEGGFGLANATWDAPNAPDVKYRISSITKIFTGLLVMQQVERGILHLDASVASYLPDFPIPIDSRITIEHLLTHTSGLPDYGNDLSEAEYDARYLHCRLPADTVVVDMLRHPLKNKPGGAYHYSNTGYVLLGLVLEAVTGERYCVLLRDEILRPAGMTDSGCLFFEPIVPRLATGYFRGKDGALLHAPFDHGIYADGMMYSTVRDLYRLDRVLRAGRLLSSETQALMNTPRWEDEYIGDDFGHGLVHYYGYGVETHRRPGYTRTDSVTVVGHGGGTVGWCSMLWRVPEDGIVITVLNNVSTPSLYIELFDILYERPYRLPTEEELATREEQ